MRHLQLRVADWMRRVFGSDKPQYTARVRALRFLEEASELAQACGVSYLEAVRVYHGVFERPAGDPPQEIGGVMITLAGLANSIDAQIQDCVARELVRINTDQVIERVRRRNAPGGDKPS